MKYLSAYTLLVLSGKTDPTPADLTSLLKEVGIEADQASVKRVVDALKGKKLEEVIAEGLKKTQTISVGGGSAPAAQAPAASKAPAAKAAPKVEEKPVEVEEDMDMGGMFD